MEIAFGIDFASIWSSFLAVIIVISVWVLSLIKNIIVLIFDIASLDFFGEEAIGELASRIYMILGILMLFKITISCIQYLINPEKSEDKENGFGSIIKRTVIALLLIAVVPSIFTFAKGAQVQISKFLPKIILGSENAIDGLEIGEEIAYTSALGFFGYSSDSCNDGSIAGLINKSGQIVKKGDSGVVFYDTDTIISNADMITKGNNCAGGARYSFNYLCVFAAVFLIFILVSMAIDVGVRTIKMGLLQILSPIPIASYIDPKTSKKSFDAWTHQCVTVYTDLFVRLGVIYFILYLFKLVFGSFKGVYVINGSSIGLARSSLVNVFIIIAMFMFTKSAPKFICDILGIKGDGNIGDMFKRASGLAGAAVGGIRTGLSNYTTQKERLRAQNKNNARLRAALSAVSGTGSAFGRGLKSATIGKKGFNDVRKSASAAAIKARDSRNDRVDNIYSHEAGNEYGYLDYQRDRMRASLGIPSTNEFYKMRYDTMNNTAKTIADAKGHGATKMNETPSLYRVALKTSDANENIVMGALGYSSMTMEQVRNAYALAKNGQTVQHANGTSVTLSGAQLEALGQVVQNVEKTTAYMKEADLMATGDPAASGYVEKLKFAIKNSKSLYNDKKVMDRIKKDMADQNYTVTDYDSFMRLIESLSEDIPCSIPKPADYDTNDVARKMYDDYKKTDKTWQDNVRTRSKLIIGIKNSFENVSRDLLPEAQMAEVRAKKEQQAVKNANDKK